MRRYAVLLVMLCLMMVACTPRLSIDVKDVTRVDIEAVVENAIEETVDSFVRAATESVVDSIVALLAESLFGGFVDVELTADFSLDVFSGTWDTRISGTGLEDARFRRQSSSDDQSDEAQDIGAAIRGIDESGNPVLGINFQELDSNADRLYELTIIDTVDESSGDRLSQAILQFEDDGDRFSGPVELALNESGDDRLQGSLNAPALVSETTGEEVAVTSDFDVPVNPVGTALFGFDSSD